jgi:hypothetical protein
MHEEYQREFSCVQAKLAEPQTRKALSSANRAASFDHAVSAPSYRYLRLASAASTKEKASLVHSTNEKFDDFKNVNIAPCVQRAGIPISSELELVLCFP